MFLIFDIWFLVLLNPSPSYPQEEQKDEIRYMYNDAVVSYKNLQDRIKKDKEKAYVTSIKEEIEEYYKLAKILEERGEYTDAAECYKKIIALTNDRALKPFISKENRRLQSEAQKVRAGLLKKINKEN